MITWDWLQVSIILGKLSAAALMGGAIGFEREVHGQAAGMRTTILVCVGSCLMMMLSLHMEELFRYLAVDRSLVRLDPGRIASYAIAGMGFLGAGAIITGKGSVRGLTTAAGLWLVTGVGLAIGAGFWVPAVATTLISLIILWGLRRFKARVHRDEYTILTLKYGHQERPLDRIKHILASNQVHIQFVNYIFEIPTETATYRLRLHSKESMAWGQIIKSLLETKGLVEISWEEGMVP